MRPGTVALLLGVSGALACSGAAENSDGDAAATQPDSAAGAITATFGPGVSLYRGGPPAEFHGDFNGDGADDLLAVTEVTRGTEPLPEGVLVLQPWSGAESRAYSRTPSHEAAMSLAIVHGASASNGGAFLLYDPAPISILATEAAREAFVASRSEVASLDTEMGRLARGDVFVLPTEAGIDTFIYWDGSTYRAYQPLVYP